MIAAGSASGTCAARACQSKRTDTMSHLTDLIDAYIAMWNETNDARRRELIARVWTEDARYLDPALEGEGRSGIDTMVRGVQERFPGHRFRRTSDVDSHHDRLRFGWELGPENGPAIVKGRPAIGDHRLLRSSAGHPGAGVSTAFVPISLSSVKCPLRPLAGGEGASAASG
jgi:SnoaL-like domain